jgi:NAD(P)-dependent dehydrogenase (short-subunit alcohol dehydrogenase family)
MSGDFAGQRILLTGALGSLGRAQAQAFAAAGAELLLVDLAGNPRAADLLATLNEIAPGSTTLVEQDLSDLEEAKARIGALVQERGPVDILINNAALILNRPFEAFSIADYEHQMRVNAGAAFALSQAVAPGMKARGRGAIINFCSVTLGGEWEGYVPYVSSKGAMLGLTKSLARELGPFGIRVNAIAPGAVVSEAEERVFGDRAQAYQEWVLARQCLKRRIEPDDVAEVVLFLAGSAAMVSGQVVAVDGGW